MNNTSYTPLSVNTVVTLTKGCEGLNLRKGETARVCEIIELGADYSHQVRVVLELRYSKRKVALYATHKNRLSDPEPALLGSVSGYRIRVRRG